MASSARQPGSPRARRLREALTAYALLLPAAFFLVFLVISVVFLIRFSLNGWDPGLGMYPSLTLSNYGDFISDPYFRGIFLKTLRLALVVTLVALVLGYPYAYLLSISRGVARNALLLIVIVPLLIDVLVRAYGWLILLGDRGLLNQTLMASGLRTEPLQILYTESSVIIELLHEILPFMILPIAAVLEKIDPSLKEAGQSLGASKLQTFLRITLPMSLPGVLAGTLLCFALSASAFVAPLVLGGGKVMVMSLLIRTQLSVLLNWPFAAAESIILVALTLVILYFYTRASRAGLNWQRA
ncbi:MAG: ABC transporter permease [Thermomicrobiales bacterium]|nr:ABC transporter permease [Thermomicrobiales bacterium]